MTTKGDNRLIRAANRGSADFRGYSVFTLLELIVVMAVVATMAAAAAPSLRGFFRSRTAFEEAARLVALTRLARQRAMAEGRGYRLHFDCGGNRFRLLAADIEPTADAAESGYGFSLAPGFRVEVVAPPGLRDTGWLPFYPDGRTMAAELRLVDDRGRAAHVRCPAPGEDFRVVAESSL